MMNDNGQTAGAADREEELREEAKTGAFQENAQAEEQKADGVRGDDQAGSEPEAETADRAAPGEGESAGTEAPQEGEAPGDGKEKKGLFHKKEKKDPREEKIEELTDRLRRSMAEFDNYRKRTDKEKAAMYEVGAKDIIEKILPVLDNLERGLAAVPEDAKGSSLAEGMEMIYKQFLKTLEEVGVTPIEAMGKAFDPSFHNAVMHVEDESLGENVVSAELQKGYMYHDSVVRHSMVQVAN